MIPNVRQPANKRSGPQLSAVCVLLALGLLYAYGAHAEKADREKPINIEADRVTVDDAKQIANFEGRVILTQGTLIIRGDRMQVRQDSQGFKSGVIWGNLANFRQKREGYDEFIEGWAKRIEYDGRAEKIQMFDRAMMKKGEDEVIGNYISYDAITEFFRVTGSSQPTASGSDGRVRAILQPKSKDKPATKPASTPQTDSNALRQP